MQQAIGILGGGQLARMTITAAMQYGVRCHVLDKDPAAPAASYTAFFHCGDPRDQETVLRFAQDLACITIDTEHVSAAALTELPQQGKFTVPAGNVLATIQNKCRQKEFLAQHGFPTARFFVAKNAAELNKIPFAFPVVQKTATAGYDGRGVKLLAKPTDLANAFHGESLVEEKVAIAKEIAVIVARDRHGQRVIYDPVEMVFDPQKHILRYQLCPARLDAMLLREAQALADAVAAQLQVVGLLAVEMFVTEDNKILINEMAPRPHNSGHHTIEAARTSQYENLVRILTGLPLRAAETTTPSLLINLLGPEPAAEARWQTMVEQALRLKNAHVHLYGKKIIKPFRKLGHITLTGEPQLLLAQLRELTGAEI
ncbi:MAG: 5-(carboxyamino)imidazole ribonucleotide synthase [Turneriella sp.]|nr:5-(carboxyamino)imidazole ribonucleotide synthase [Turneriella sp.]